MKKDVPFISFIFSWFSFTYNLSNLSIAKINSVTEVLNKDPDTKILDLPKPEHSFRENFWPWSNRIFQPK